MQTKSSNHDSSSSSKDSSSVGSSPIANGKPLSSWLLFLAIPVLLLLGLTKLPTGYLHSWNQITTMAMARSIAEDISSVFAPQDVATLLSWNVSSPESRYTVYEEFPLYQLGMAALNRLGISLEIAGRLLSIFGFVLALLAVRRLAGYATTSALARQFTVSVFAVSFPMLYYGQAVMSDMAMSAGLLWMLVFALQGQRFDAAVKASVAALLAGLFKSYALIFFPVLLLMIRRRYWWLVLVAATPVLLWHGFALTQPGHQEGSSHSLLLKLSTAFDIQFPLLLGERLIRLLGYLGVGLLLFGFRSWAGQRSPWLRGYALCSAAYLFLTADKLADHDYYFLALLPLFPMAIATSIEAVLSRSHSGLLLQVLLVGTLIVSAKAQYKATRENSDVLACAEALRRHSEPGETVAVLATNERYNSIQYYGKRKGFSIQPEAFTAQDYVQQGVRVFAMNVLETELNQFQPWMRGLSEVFSATYPDFKDRARSCKIAILSAPAA